MTQVMGDGTRHSADGRQLFRFQQIALGLEEAGTHAVEGVSEFGDIISSAGVERMMEVTAFQSTYSSHQRAQGAGEGMGKEEHQSASYQNGGKTQQEQIAIQVPQKPGRLIVGA